MFSGVAMIHIPVMLKEVLEFLNLKDGDCIVDGTVGTAGHSMNILTAVGPAGQLIGIDRDGDSLLVAEERLKSFAGRYRLVKDDFRNIDHVLDSLGIRQVNGMLLDLGISSYQLEDAQRGFSIKSEGPLDMRMDKNSYISAYDLVNSLSEGEIASILKNFGQERWHHRIASYLVKQRSKAPIESTQDLSDTVLRAIPHRYQNQKIHPATRTFQAFRIAVNRELEALEVALDKAVDYLSPAARLCVISFHSLEDKIVKEKFLSFAKQGKVKLITKKPLRPSPDETNDNPRARSARLRVAEKG
ncbi:MAG TPA: 16S rRNA (cytosine(1402)-N(4))-methyltransferase RsmH [Candidatus Omnitrophota bacterium]|nr:16S rRNA (cytosine(1402)-N(4))-methyltransferase RsmH [Candidatus Omnitrophota bacterium]HPD85096.1 16S rRNA (cytosine(1402)-N(4))-methyltransferase RsmH [Candidatus Omnitrophota bacterium]HRZ03954.1 16S rRNA (cytosine(1402)-N(4))-methyltransferase RsmH [Candidatus Omnitrophota bacterium]